MLGGQQNPGTPISQERKRSRVEAEDVEADELQEALKSNAGLTSMGSPSIGSRSTIIPGSKRKPIGYRTPSHKHVADFLGADGIPIETATTPSRTAARRKSLGGPTASAAVPGTPTSKLHVGEMPKSPKTTKKTRDFIPPSTRKPRRLSIVPGGLEIVVGSPKRTKAVVPKTASTPTSAARSQNIMKTPGSGVRGSVMQKRKVPVRSNATVASARNCILGRITGRTTPLELIELSEQYRKVYTLLEQTVSEGEANSVLLLGSRGTGKTAVVRKALQALRQKFTPRPLPPTEGGQEEGGQPQTGKTFFEVYLNGLFHTDDRLALREIIRQLHLEQQLDDQQLGSFAECLAFVLNTLSAGSKESTPVIFVLDEIDLFAQHPKQALLYNLFDIAQSSQNPIAVVGLTCRMDFIYLLEKRVKSRFSHRHVYFHPPQTIGQFEQVLQATLCLSPEDPVKEPYYVTEFNKAVQAVLRQPEIQTILKETFELNKDVRTLLRIFYGAVIRLSILSPFLTAGSVLESAVRQRLDQKMEIIQSLSMLELCLLIAMKQQESRQVEAFNFEMVYDDYRDFVQKANSYGGGVRSLFFVKPVAFKAFEHLLSLEMMKPIDGAGVQCPKEHRMVRLLLSSQQIEMGVKAYKECPEAVVRWATS